jgi:hypothetical protein
MTLAPTPRPFRTHTPDGHCQLCGVALNPNAKDDAFCSTDHRADFAVRLLTEMSLVKSLAALQQERRRPS